MGYLTREGYKSEYTKSIGIKPKKLELIDKIKGRKSKSGKLDEIIDFYIEQKKLNVLY